MTLDEALRELREAGWRDGADIVAELRGMAQRSAVLSVSAAIETFKPATPAQVGAQRAAGAAIQRVAALLGIEILCASCGGPGGFPHVAEECAELARLRGATPPPPKRRRGRRNGKIRS